MSPSDEIKGDIRQYPISSCPEYHAVSYCWGDPTITHYITLNGQQFGVPSNLYSFLTHFSAMNKMSPIWVDAICIDQQSVSERNHQVGLMGSIYRSAISVFAWLGPINRDMQTALQYMHNCMGCGWPGSKYIWHTGPRPGNALSCWYHETASDSFARLLNADYWYRTWILQELLLAAKVELLCGTTTVPWDILRHIFDHFYRLRDRTLLWREREILECVPFRIMRQRHSMEMRSAQLHTLLELFRDTNSADPRDKVYALLGLAVDRVKFGAIVPDYGKRNSELYCDVMQFNQDLRPERKFRLASILRESLQVTIDDILCSMVTRDAHLWSSFVSTAQLSSILQTATVGFAAFPCYGTQFGFVEAIVSTIDMSSAHISYGQSDSFSPPPGKVRIHATETAGLSTSLYQGIHAYLGMACDSTRRGDLIYKVDGFDAAVVVRQEVDRFIAVGGALLNGSQDCHVSQTSHRISFLLQPEFVVASGLLNAGV